MDDLDMMLDEYLKNPEFKKEYDALESEYTKEKVSQYLKTHGVLRPYKSRFIRKKKVFA